VKIVILPVIAFYYIYLYFVSKQTEANFMPVALLVHVVLFVAILLDGRWGFDAWIIEILAAFQGLTLFLWIYTLLWSYVIKNFSILIWMSISSVFVATISFIWFAFKKFYVNNAQSLALGIHNQDLLFSVFMFLCALSVYNIKITTTAFNAELVSWLLPMSTLWFTVESKMLANLGQGSPFHPSWSKRGFAPLWATDEVINATFWLATTFLTISTYYTGITILLNMGTEKWLIYTFHGILAIALSATWMIIASSGLPAPVHILEQYSIRPFVQFDHVKAVNIHLYDIYPSIALIIFGIVQNAADDRKLNTIPYNKFGAYAVLSVLWALFVSQKLQLIKI